MPVEVRRQAFAGSRSPLLRGIGIVENRSYRLGECRDVTRRERQPGHTVDDSLAKTAHIGGCQGSTGRGGLKGHDAEWFVVAGQYGDVDAVQ